MPALREPLTSPTMRAFANELGAWREDAKLTKAELSRLLGYTAQYLGQVEDCKNKPSKRFSEDCDTFFKTNGVFVRLWRNLTETRYQAILPSGFPEYLEQEAQATAIRIFNALLVDGLFQTPEVVHAIMADASDTETAAELANKRLERQAAILDRENPPQIFLVLDEFVLHRVIGDNEIHRAQLEHLLTLSELPHIMVQVVPQKRGYYPGLIGSFTWLSFEDGSQAAYGEAASTGLLIEHPAQIAKHVIRYDLIRGHALPVDESRAMIESVKELL